MCGWRGGSFIGPGGEEREGEREVVLRVGRLGFD